MFEKIKSITSRPFFKNIIIMATGTFAAQGLAIALTPVITRLYGPEAFGVMGTFTSIFSIFATIAALTYPAAIVIAKNKEEIYGLIKLSITIIFTLAFLTTVTLFLFNDQFSNLLKLGDSSPFLYLIPLVIVMAGTLEIVENILIRYKEFKVKAKMTFYQSLVINSAKVGIGFFYPYGSILIISSALNYGLKAFMMWSGVLRAKIKVDINQVKLQNTIKIVSKSYKDFPLYRAPQVLLNSLSHSFPVLLLASLFGPISVGFFTVGKNVMNLPAQFVGKAVGDVYYPRVTDASKNNESIYKLILKVTLSLALIGIIPFGIIILFGPYLFELVFGEGWKGAGEYARWIAIWTFFMFVNSPSIKAFPILKAQAFHLKFTILTTILPILSMYIMYRIYNTELVTVATFCLVNSLLNITLILITLRKSRKFDELNKEI
ncbi:oligosaccharide flippase family protein [Halobacillus sp. Cin3]|uniref:lipopolysaccharide biosynthesis protein n=1 Tax=Halobacillus sp. Cin3 TaxID=2928441 RepID=UPI00248DD3CE|nr:oligosaccharide flippase family protein [Halobacillus sp. Cin3]